MHFFLPVSAFLKLSGLRKAYLLKILENYNNFVHVYLLYEFKLTD